MSLKPVKLFGVLLFILAVGFWTFGLSFKFNLIPDKFNGNLDGWLISAPTHALAIEWIRVNFGIGIAISPKRGFEFKWYVYFYNGKELLGEIKFAFFNSPQEATEAALLYTLKNLIK